MTKGVNDIKTEAKERKETIKIQSGYWVHGNNGTYMRLFCRCGRHMAMGQEWVKHCDHKNVNDVTPISITGPDSPADYTIYFKMLSFPDTPAMLYLLSNNYPPELDRLPSYACSTFETRLKEQHPNIKCCNYSQFKEIADALNREEAKIGWQHKFERF